MPKSTLWLNDDLDVVDRDQATLAYEKDIDDEGRFVGDRWIRMIRPDSPEADRIAIELEARRIANAGPGRRPKALLGWGIVVILLAAAAIWLLLG